jgi:uncharacterized protein (TIGR00369 family)
MTQEDHYRKLERMYLAAPTNQYYKPTIQIDRGVCTIEFPVRPDFFHAVRAIHGSVYFKALDDAAFFAVNSLVAEHFVLTVTFHLHFLRPVSQGVLHAEGQMVSASRDHFVGASILTVDGKEVARGSGTFLRSKGKLSEIESYR